MPQNDSKGPDNKNRQLTWSTPQAEQSKAPHSTPQPQQIKSAPVIVMAPGSSSAAAERSASRIVWWLVVGVVAGVVLAWIATNTLTHKSASSSDNNALTSASSTSDASQEQATSTLLTVASPQKAGLSVAVSNVTVSTPTWVVVYESRNGTPGNVLGAGLFFPETPWGSVELLRGTSAGQTYFVTERKDDGDRKFSLDSDPVVLGADGQPSWVTFVAN